MKRIIDKENHDVVSSTWPYGKIRDDSGANDGTPVNADVYQDHHQFFEKLMDDNLEPPNGQLDNSVNGFQLNDALTRQIFGANLITKACTTQTTYNILQGELLTNNVAVIFGDSTIIRNGNTDRLQINASNTIFVVYNKNVYVVYQNYLNNDYAITNNQTVYILKGRGVFGLPIMSIENTLPNATPLVINSWLLDTYEKPFIVELSQSSVLFDNPSFVLSLFRINFDLRNKQLTINIRFTFNPLGVVNSGEEAILNINRSEIPEQFYNVIQIAINRNENIVCCYAGLGHLYPSMYKLATFVNGISLRKMGDANNYNNFSDDYDYSLNFVYPL